MDASFRRTGLDVLGRIPWGAHVCLFYKTKQDLLDACVAYFKPGLEDNELCVWAISEPITEQDAREALAQEAPGFERHVAERRMEFLPGREWYLDGKDFDMQRITGGWHEKLRSALARGFAGMRVSGNAFWLGTAHWKDFMEYERELDRSLAGQPMIVLCTYPLDASRSADLLDVARAHNVTVARRNGAWEVVEAFETSAEPNALTEREREVLNWVARGKSAWEIGQILHITKRTVDEHVQNARRKLGASNRTEAVTLAVHNRMIDPRAPLPHEPSGGKSDLVGPEQIVLSRASENRKR
jgi:DNA-binding CsgD family transcriptional regulator